MAAYSLTIKSSAAKEIQRVLDKETLPRLIEKIKSLATQPRPSGSEKLAGRSNIYRIRQGNYRVIYSVDDQSRIVDVVKVVNRRSSNIKIQKTGPKEIGNSHGRLPASDLGAILF